MRNFKNIITNWFESVKKTIKSLKQNRDLLVFLVFLVLSTALWFLNALRKEYTTTISYPIKYSNFPDDFILLGKPQGKLLLKIKSLGYSALPYHFGKIINPESLNVSAFRRFNNDGKHGAYVPTREMLKRFSDQLSNGVELLDISPDTLFIFFEKKERKMVPVRFDGKLNFKKQFYQSGKIELKPDSVLIAGPASLVDSISYINTSYRNYENPLDDSLVRNISLHVIDNLEVNPRRVVINIPVEPFTQKNMRIPIDHLNVPDSLTLKSFPSVINVSFTVAVSRFNDVTPQDFSAIVDYNAVLGSGLPDRLKIRLLQQPEGVKNVNYSPLFVECLFEKKQSYD